MARLTEEMVIARSRASDLASIKKLNCWGSDLADITLLRRMLSVEVLSLSVNKINSLSDFQYCRNLQELYVRKNEIRDLNEVCYLQELPNLKCLWLADNPCADVSLYRPTVLKALPRLQKLDNIAVEPEEVQDAMRRGLDLYHPEEQQPPPPPEYENTSSSSRRKGPNHSHHSSPPESPQGSPEQCWTLRPETPVHHQQHSPSNGHEEGFEARGEDPEEAEVSAAESAGAASLAASSPHADMDSSVGGALPLEDVDPERVELWQGDSEEDGEVSRIVAWRERYDTGERRERGPQGGGKGDEEYMEDRYERSPPRRLLRQPSDRDMDIGEGTGIRRGQSGLLATTPNDDEIAYYDNDRRNANNCEQPEYGYTRQVVSYGTVYEAPTNQVDDDQQHYDRLCRQQMQQTQQQGRPTGLHLHPSGKQPSSRANVARPKTRSNVLSAILCLLKELDYPSLEVVEMAVRSRMDEFED